MRFERGSVENLRAGAAGLWDAGRVESKRTNPGGARTGVLGADEIEEDRIWGRSVDFDRRGIGAVVRLAARTGCFEVDGGSRAYDIIKKAR